MKAAQWLRRGYRRLFKTYEGHAAHSMTASGACLWNFVLSNKQMKGYVFLRNSPVLHYAAEFLCMSLMLVIVVENKSISGSGRHYLSGPGRSVLEKAGFRFLRFTADEVLSKTKAVRSEIETHVQAFEKTAAQKRASPLLSRQIFLWYEGLPRHPVFPDSVRKRNGGEPTGDVFNK